MAGVVEPTNRSQDRSPDAELATRVAKLWPHREHEAHIMLGQFCHAGFHWWRQLDLSSLVPGKEVSYCFSCKKVKIDGVIYDP